MPTKNPQILFTVEEDLFKEIEDFRFDNRIQTRSEAVRRLLKEGLKQLKGKPAVQDKK